MNRKQFIRNTSIAGAGVLVSPSFSFAKREANFPVVRVAAEKRHFQSAAIEKAIAICIGGSPSASVNHTGVGKEGILCIQYFKVGHMFASIGQAHIFASAHSSAEAILISGENFSDINGINLCLITCQ